MGNRNRNNVNNGIENTTPVNPEVAGEEVTAEAAPQTEGSEPENTAPEVVEKKEGKLKKIGRKISKAYNEGITLPPIKTVVKTVGIAAAGAAAAVLVIAKVRNGDEVYDDRFALEDSSDSTPDFEATFEDVPEAEE